MSNDKRAWLRQLGVTTLPAEAPPPAPAMAEADTAAPGGFGLNLSASLRTSISVGLDMRGEEVLNIGAGTPPQAMVPPPPLRVAPPPAPPPMREEPPPAPPPPTPEEQAHAEEDAREDEELLNVVAEFGEHGGNTPPPMRDAPQEPHVDPDSPEEQAREEEELLNVVATFGNQQDEPPAPPPLAGGDTSKEALFGIPGIPDIPDLPDPTIKVSITIDNQSGHVLKFVGSKLENPNGSEFDGNPPGVVAKNKTAHFSVSNNFPYLTGVGGEVTYAVADEPDTTIFMKWERGRVPDRGTVQEVRPASDKFSVSGDFNDDAFTFTFVGLDDPGPGPGPNTQDVEANCQITVTNNTQVELQLTNQGHDVGDFMTFPAAKLAPGAATSFVSTRTKGAKEHGCKGFLTWNVGTDGAVWRVDWNNPVGEKNTATAEINPASAGFDSLEQIGQGEENVPVAFTLSGGGGGGTKPIDPPPEDKPFVPPPQSKQPTLRKGDSSDDGWVEYLQQLLGVPVDGKFGPATQAAVIAFQKKNKLQVDGTVGNQTWAALRGTAPEAPSTDGRKPHTFEEAGKEARWFTANEPCVWFQATDGIGMMVESVGDDAEIEGRTATFVITPPGGKTVNRTGTIGKAVQRSPSGNGNLHQVNLGDFTKTSPSVPPGATADTYKVDAYLEQELGGDHWSGNPKVQAA